MNPVGKASTVLQGGASVALCPEPGKGQLQAEDLSPRARFHNTLREMSPSAVLVVYSFHLEGWGCFPQEVASLRAALWGNVAATNHSQLFTIFPSSLRKKETKKISGKVRRAAFQLLFPAFISASATASCLLPHRYFDSKPQKPQQQVLHRSWGNSPGGGEEIGTKLLLILLSVFIYFGPIGLDRN